MVGPPLYAPDLDLLTLKVVLESRVTWATSLPILVFLGLCFILFIYSVIATLDKK